MMRDVFGLSDTEKVAALAHLTYEQLPTVNPAEPSQLMAETNLNSHKLHSKIN